MQCDKKSLLLYAVTDPSWLQGRTLEEVVQQAIRGGITCLQFREKNLPWQACIPQAQRLKELCKQQQIPFIINDAVELALAVDADGVHIGQKDEAAARVRKKIGTQKILGVSVQTVEQARKAQQDGADYLGVGAVFPTDTKQDADSVSFAELQRICQSVSIPVIAIGGIHPQNIHHLRGSGICGVAVVSAIFAAAEISSAATELKALAADCFQPSPIS